MYVHKEEILEKAVRSSSFPITLLAERLGKSRRYVYNLFENPDVSIDIVLTIGKIIQYDFNNDPRGLAKIPIEYQLEKLTEVDIDFENPSYWKSKYFELVDQHKLLLKNCLEDYFNKDK